MSSRVVTQDWARTEDGEDAAEDDEDQTLMGEEEEEGMAASGGGPHAERQRQWHCCDIHAYYVTTADAMPRCEASCYVNPKALLSSRRHLGILYYCRSNTMRTYSHPYWSTLSH